MKANGGYRLMLLSAALLWMLTPAGACAQSTSDDAAAVPQLSGWDAPPAVVDRGRAVQAEASQLPDHAWAGAYYAGDGLGMNVRLLVSPAAGVSATWHGCLGLYGSNEGLIQPQPDGSLKFAFNKPNENRFGGFPDAVLPVRWGERRYLIGNDQIDEFVSAINFGSEPRRSARAVLARRRRRGQSGARPAGSARTISFAHSQRSAGSRRVRRGAARDRAT